MSERAAGRGLSAVLLVLLAAQCGAARAQEYAPTDRPGPQLTEPEPALDTALKCGGRLRAAVRPAILFVAGTGGTPEENYSWNYMPAVARRGFQWCGVTVPDHTLADVQVQAEYIVHAIRAMYAATARPIAVVGYSQGGMTPRWALRFWPDVRPMVDDMISLAADNHGTAAAEQFGVCAETCPAASWQNLPGSALLRALNAPVETFAGISYSQIFTNYDELSTPAGRDGTSPLRTGRGHIANIALQDVCPANLSEHALIGTVDPVGFALVVDALEHDGPASAARVGSSPCAEVVLPGADVTKAGTVAGVVPFLLAGATVVNLPGVRRLDAEPPLRCYVFATCRAPLPVASVHGRMVGPSSLVLTAASGNDSFALRSLRIRLPAGVRVGPQARVRLRADGVVVRRPKVKGPPTGIHVTSPPVSTSRLSLRTLADALRVGPRTRARLAAGRSLRTQVVITWSDARTSRLTVRLHASEPKPTTTSPSTAVAQSHARRGQNPSPRRRR